jgi:hypothetical protein
MRNTPIVSVALVSGCLFFLPLAATAQDAAPEKSEAVIAFETLCKQIQQQPASASDAVVWSGW